MECSYECSRCGVFITYDSEESNGRCTCLDEDDDDE
jgi:DNA-directed RNA polymerase subunit RPC12/RpoP